MREVIIRITCEEAKRLNDILKDQTGTREKPVRYGLENDLKVSFDVQDQIKRQIQ